MVSNLERYRHKIDEYAGTIVLLSDNGFKRIFQFLTSLGQSEDFKLFEVIVVLRGVDDITYLALEELHAIKIISLEEDASFGRVVENVVLYASTDYLMFFEDSVKVVSHSKINILKEHNQSDIIGFRAYIKSKKCYPQCIPLNIGKSKKYRYAFIENKYGKFCDIESSLHFHPVAFSITRHALLARLSRVINFRSLETVSATLINSNGLSFTYFNHASLEVESDLSKQDMDQEWASYFAQVKSFSDNFPIKSIDNVSKPYVLYIDDRIPRPDQNEGSIYSLNLMRIFVGLGYQVDFHSLYMGDADRAYMIELQSVGVCVLNEESSCLVRNISCYRNRYSCVILSRAHNVHQYVHVCRHFMPQAKIVFNTIDLHYLRLAREAILKKDRKLLKVAKEVKMNEINGIISSDATIVISEYEHDFLMKDDRLKNIHIIPIIRDFKEFKADRIQDKKDLIFIGTYEHPPNYDAALFMIQSIWPILKVELPVDANLYMVGNIGSTDLMDYQDNRVKVLGHVPDIYGLLSKSKVGLAPLRFGAGLKGKVITYMEAGLPVVSTSIAIEGTGLKHGVNVLVSDSVEGFAENILELYRDQNLWKMLSENGRRRVRELYSLERAKQRVKEMFKSINI